MSGRWPKPNRAAVLDHPQAQLELEDYRRELAQGARAAGARRTQQADPDGFEHDKAILEMLAARGGDFDADDAHDWGAFGGPALGSAFHALAQAGEIESVGFTTSRRQQRHGGIVRRWRGVRP